MKRILVGIAAAATLLATGALAADLPVKAPVYKAPVEVFGWTGFYVGGNIGYSAGQADNSTTIDRFLTGLPLPGTLIGTNSAKNAADGFIGGGQIGYNWQITNWLVGLEADIQASGERGSSSVICLACSDDGTNIVTRLDQSLNWFGTVRGRAGILATPDAVFYATGGLAYGEVNVTGSATGNFNQTTVFLPGNSSTRFGWTVGAGVEGHIGGNWTAKLEYLYMDLGSVSGGPMQLTGILVPVRTVAGLSYSSHFTDNIVRAGINYHFNSPVVAKY
ncbi:outer membrane protein [Bradyrhizobium sp.]|uniref:outer membrane protein n=1 Tax=Bradyrhizobium sp. TaxID=376 RepID=UPI002D2B4F02|nr:outer membrane beta-barrel protein [Bradyrhizobium sp.]HZR76009.1 outer membrane beta-barrel protein [Bradyrhizobium sp.]